MKNTITFFTILLFSLCTAQNFEKQWNKVYDAEQDGMITSANDLVLKIYEKAKKKQNEAQIIKCFFFNSKYILEIEEDAQNKILANLQREMHQGTLGSKALFTIIYIETLNAYNIRNGYKLSSRTPLEKTEDGNFTTWGKNNFEDEIFNKSKLLIDQKDVLENISLEKYEAVFDYFSKPYLKKASIYDYVVDRILNLYTKNYYDLTSNLYTFKKSYPNSLIISQKEYNTLNFDTIKNKKLKMVFELFKYKPKNSDGIIQEVERLNYFTNDNYKKPEKYFSLLNQLETYAKDTLDIQNILFEKAQFISNKANKKTCNTCLVDAVKTYDSILFFKNKSNVFILAESKKNEILSKSFNLNFEKYIYENQNHRAYISFQNIKNLKISIYKINTNQVLSGFAVEKIINSQKPYKQQNYMLNAPEDFYQYSTEIVLPKLEIDTYLILAENEDNKKNYTFETLTVSNLIAYNYLKDNAYTFEVLNRKTGKPEPNCKIKLENYTVTTDADGKAIFESSLYNSLQNKYNLDIKITKENDTLSLNTYTHFDNLDRDYSNDNDNEVKVQFFLDRSIYRPGQKVFYKGIATVITKEKIQILPHLNLKIIVENANDEDFKTFTATTNEYGSFSGEFDLPKEILTGNFKIYAEEPDDIKQDEYYNKIENEHTIWDRARLENNYVYFKVEEYKRPKFEISFKPNSNTYKLNDKIVVQGSAKAFAGSSLSNATVNFEIKYKSFSTTSKYYPDGEAILKTGKTTTDAYGNFEIEFIAQTFNENPLYFYEVNAIVTDENGETRSSETTIKVSKNSVFLKIASPKIIDKSTSEKIAFISQNVNENFVPITGKIEVYFIEELSKKIKRSPFYSKPEIQSISNEEFEKLFPYEAIENPNKSSNRTLIFSQDINTEKDKFITTQFLKNQKSGSYEIVFSSNYKNESLQEKAFFIAKNPTETGNELIVLKQSNANPKKDGFLKVNITTAIPNLFISCLAFQNGNCIYKNNLEVEGNVIEVSIPINTKIEGFVNFSLQTIFDNQSFSYKMDYLLTNEIDKIAIETEIFRDKLQPGKNETWSFIIKENDTKTQAEALATMYDASLDQFYYNPWKTNIDQRRYQRPFSHKKNILGLDIESLNLWNSRNSNYNTINDKTELIWFGFDINFKGINTNKYKDQIIKKKKQDPNSRTITGIVKDEYGMPLSGANVKNGYEGVSTDNNGKFSITARQGDELKISYAGLQTYLLTIGSLSNYTIKMIAGAKVLEEVVVVGMNVMKRKEAITSCSQQIVESKEIAQAANPSIIQKLAGKVSGLQIETVNNGYSENRVTLRGNRSVTGNNDALIVIDGVISSADALINIPPDNILEVNVIKGAQGAALFGSDGVNGVVIITTKKSIEELSQVVTRKNLSETAFFFPHLKTDEKGKIAFSFTTPEALTRWKFRLLAHTQKAQSTYLEKTAVTQKEIMVFPNFPRFFKEKDQIKLVVKISNLTTKPQSGKTILQFFDAVTMQPVDVNNVNKIKPFAINPSGNITVNWDITIPEGIQALQYKIVAKTNDFSDGEESIIPVIPNAVLITESIPIWVRENTSKTIVFDTFKNATSTTLKNQSYTVEYTSNPAWLALQSLPYLMEFEHECAEQTFARFYANLLSYQIVQSNPKIQAVLKKWKNEAVPISKFYQNEELKSILLAETPWIEDVLTDEEKKKNFAKLLDTEKCKTDLKMVLEKLLAKQKPSGGFAWFDGGNENEYITRHIIAGLGHINTLFKDNEFKPQYLAICSKAIPYLDNQFITRTNQTNATYISDELHYLYARGFFIDSFKIDEKLNQKIDEKLNLISKNWLNYSLHDKAVAALVLFRFAKIDEAKKIINSLKDTAINNTEVGMYWLENKAGWYWNQSPIENQALLIEAFLEIANDTKSIEAMKAWLIKNKQTNNWNSTKSTTEAIYALLQGNTIADAKNKTEIKIGKQVLLPIKNATSEENEIGYLKQQWKPQEITKDLSKIYIENKSKMPGFGGIYWQYFENSDAIKSSNTSKLNITKELFLKSTINQKTVLQKIIQPLHVGDCVTIRLTISAEEGIEYVHVKDARASCFEPKNVLSEYKWQDALGYYMSTKDTATHFFFDAIPTGTYIIEYDVIVNNSGNFATGISSIESMYAPEFSSHTQGGRIPVE